MSLRESLALVTLMAAAPSIASAEAFKIDAAPHDTSKAAAPQTLESILANDPYASSLVRSIRATCPQTPEEARNPMAMARCFNGTKDAIFTHATKFREFIETEKSDHPRRDLALAEIDFYCIAPANALSQRTDIKTLTQAFGAFSKFAQNCLVVIDDEEQKIGARFQFNAYEILLSHTGALLSAGGSRRLSQPAPPPQ
jgi:hypothetical protein